MVKALKKKQEIKAFHIRIGIIINAINITHFIYSLHCSNMFDIYIGKIGDAGNFK
jgi:hypothetical protein